jgi:hypothetical protein
VGAERKARSARARRRGFLRGRANARRAKALQWVPVEYPDADRLAEPRRQPANRECPPAAGEPFLVPEFIARHQDPVVQVLTDRMMLFYGRRKAFKRPLLNRQSGLVIPAFPELLQRPAKRFKKGETPPDQKPDFQWRRSDHMQPVVRVLLVLVGCCDWVSMEIMDPRGGYLSVARLAELAELPVDQSDPSDPEERARLRVSRTEHALRTLRTAGILCFTKQYREKLEDGRHVSTGPALRKLAVGFFRKFGGEILRVFERRRRKVTAKRQLEAPTTSDLRIAAEIRETRRLMAGHGRTPPAATSRPRSAPRATPQWLIDQVQSEDPSKTFDEVLREAHRRLERGPPHAGPPANDTEPT